MHIEKDSKGPGSFQQPNQISSSTSRPALNTGMTAGFDSSQAGTIPSKTVRSVQHEVDQALMLRSWVLFHSADTPAQRISLSPGLRRAVVSSMLSPSLLSRHAIALRHSCSKVELLSRPVL